MAASYLCRKQPDYYSLRFSAPEIYAVVLKETQEPIGSIGLLLKEANENQEAEIGYWIGKPYWGQGLIPEAVRCILQRGFTELNLITIWGGYYEGNNQSCKVMKNAALFITTLNMIKYHL